MNVSIEKIIISSEIESAGSKTFRLFDKTWPVLPVSNVFRVIVNRDYPMIGLDDVDSFSRFAVQHAAVVSTACPSVIHPYRILTVDDDGNEAYLFDIPKDIRGNRHCYPAIYNIRPALVGIPPGCILDETIDRDAMILYRMPKEKLLDKTILLESLMVNGIL